MKAGIIAGIILHLSSICAFSQSQVIITIGEDLELLKLTENTYIHISYTNTPNYGRVGSNGLIFIDNGEAYLFDTPMETSVTMQLVDYLRDGMGLKLAAFIPNHWHIDCMGGLAYLQELGIPSYANEMTIKLASENDLPLPDNGFKDSLELNPGAKPVHCYFLGGAHSTDNIVVWIPSEKLLFPGCMVKGLSSSNLGNTQDGDLNAYAKTLEKLLEKFPEVEIVVPGHGAHGGKELIKHTLELAKQVSN